MTASASTHAPSTSLVRLLEQGARSSEIASFLDSLSPDARLHEVLSITGKKVGRLYEAVADAPTLSVEEFVPENTSGTLIYEGRNSLPMFSRFQKRFARVKGPSGESVVVGYNFQSMSAVTGPGLFVVKAPSGSGPLGNELLFDYTEKPPVIPEGWPAYKPNDQGLSKPVFGNLNDYCRRVAKGVVVGKAYRLGKAEDAWFSLTLPG